MMISQPVSFLSRAIRGRILLLLASVLAACSPQDDATGRNDEEGRKRRLPILQEVKVEIRKDGLAYLPGATLPFTGDAISLHYDRTPPRLFVRTPYRDGKIDGIKTTYSSGGKLREERTYKYGTPVTCVVYHGNGQKKIELQLNSRDKGEGPYRRWHDNGQLEAESLLDAEERLHGEEKDYDRDGKLVAHYRNEHGRLVEVISENPELKAARIAKWGPSVPGDPPAKAAPPQP
jgi:hypothetical protein